MKKIILFVLCCLLISSLAYAGATVKKAGSQPIDTSGNLVQNSTAYDGTAALALTVYSTVKDMTNYLGYAVYTTATGCVERWMPAVNSTKSSYVATPIVANSWQTGQVNTATKFVNYSGCTSSYLKRF